MCAPRILRAWGWQWDRNDWADWRLGWGTGLPTSVGLGNLGFVWGKCRKLCNPFAKRAKAEGRRMESAWPTRRASLRAGLGQRARGSGFLGRNPAPEPLPQCPEVGHSKKLGNAFVWRQEGMRIQEILGSMTMPRQVGEGVLGSLVIF